ncbi:hypothetical protein [Joostella sp. CR20]|uniref:hypothetical protein n=1 Tax=Joostella sp. CR20 TaxID=2804312 RepID=UPI00313EB7F1
MNEHKLQLFKSQIEVSFYITMLTFKLYLQGDKSAYLFKKALKLEEKSTFVVASLIKEDVSPTLHKELTHHFHMQEKRIIALKNIIKNHYDALPQES